MIDKKIIGLTGGISSGKTTVANYLENKYQIHILDADIYAREAVANDSPILKKIIQRYGKKILLPNQTLNRQKLGEIIFNDSEEKIWLESQIHPFVKDCFLRKINQLQNSVIVLVIPLLFESKMIDLVTEIWVVTCSDEQQLQRTNQIYYSNFSAIHITYFR